MWLCSPAVKTLGLGALCALVCLRHIINPAVPGSPWLYDVVKQHAPHVGLESELTHTTAPGK